MMKVAIPVLVVQLLSARIQHSQKPMTMLAWSAVYSDVLTAMFLFLVRDEGSWKVCQLPERMDLGNNDRFDGWNNIIYVCCCLTFNAFNFP